MQCDKAHNAVAVDFTVAWSRKEMKMLKIYYSIFNAYNALLRYHFLKVTENWMSCVGLQAG